MAGTRAEYRYRMVSRNGSAEIQGLIDVDADAITATIGGRANTQPVGLPLNDQVESFVPVLNGKIGRTIRARTALLRYTGARPPGRKSDLVWVPVLTAAVFNAWRVDQTGTHKGLPVILLRKVDGRPNVRGR